MTHPTLATYAEIKARHELQNPLMSARSVNMQSIHMDRAALLHHVERLAEALKELNMAYGMAHVALGLKPEHSPVFNKVEALISSLALPQEPDK